MVTLTLVSKDDAIGQRTAVNTCFCTISTVLLGVGLVGMTLQMTASGDHLLQLKL